MRSPVDLVLPDNAGPEAEEQRLANARGHDWTLGPLQIQQWEHERSRRFICDLVVVIYYLLILEGVLRKWVAPAYQRPLFFIRDPFVLLIYVLAIGRGFWPRRSLMFWAGMALALLGFISMIAHLDSVPLIIMGYGWRNYFLYIPLAFIIGEYFTEREWARVVRFTFIVSVPIALLCVVQSVSPATSPINAGFGNIGDMFIPLGVVGNITRASGPFSSTSGLNLYVGSLFALLLVELMRGGVRACANIIVLCGVVAAPIILVTSGSRGAFVLVLVVLVGGTGLLVLEQRARTAVSLWAAGSVLFGLLYAGGLIFNRQSGAIAERFEGTAETDAPYSFGLIDRALGDFTHFTTYMTEVGPLGNGLGLGGNAAYIDELPGNIVGAEDDWSRNIVDLGPVLGLLYIIYRCAFVGWLVVGALRVRRLVDDPLSVLLISFIGIMLLYGQITGQGTINCYAWLFAGFCMAANNGRLFAPSSDRNPPDDISDQARGYDERALQEQSAL